MSSDPTRTEWQSLIFGSYSMDRVLDCVSDPAWQAVRQDMLGRSLTYKFASLQRWVGTAVFEGELARRKVQVTNYVHALKRGGLVKL